jgi:hypothetical protein
VAGAGCKRVSEALSGLNANAMGYGSSSPIDGRGVLSSSPRNNIARI